MYMEDKDIQALKLLLRCTRCGTRRVHSKKARAKRQLTLLIQQNDKKIKKQRKTINKMTRVPVTGQHNNPWE